MSRPRVTRRCGTSRRPTCSPDTRQQTSNDVVRADVSAGPANAPGEAEAGAPHIAGSAVVLGTARLGEGSLLAQGAVVRSHGAGVELGTGSAVLENCAVVGNSRIPTSIGRRSVFGHRCVVVGAAVGDLRQLGNAPILIP